MWGERLDPDQVTKDTALTPCQTRRAGSRHAGRIARQNMWAFDGFGDKGGREWTSLEEGLAFVLDRLRGAEHIFARLKTEHSVEWWCGHFQSRFDGGPRLSGHLLERLSDFGAALFIDNYFAPTGASNNSSSSARLGTRKSRRPK